MNKIALCINVCADDWTGESAIIASNVLYFYRKYSSPAPTQDSYLNAKRNFNLNGHCWTVVLQYVRYI